MMVERLALESSLKAILPVKVTAKRVVRVYPIAGNPEIVGLVIRVEVSREELDLLFLDLKIELTTSDASRCLT